MSMQQRIRDDDAVVTDWRMVGIGAGIAGGSVLAIGVALVVMALLQPAAKVTPVVDATPRRAAIAVPDAEAASAPVLPEPVVLPPPPPFPPETPAVVRPAVSTLATVARIAPPAVVVEAPAVATAKPARASAARPFYPYLSHQSEAELVADLQKAAQELTLEKGTDECKKLFEAQKNAHETAKELARSVAGSAKRANAPPPREQVLVDLVKDRPDLAGLPLRLGAECRTDPEAAKRLPKMASLARSVQASIRTEPHASLAPSTYDAAQQEAALKHLKAYTSKIKGFNRVELVPAMEQVLQAERPVDRLMLVAYLATVDDPTSTAALARRAVFDLSREVREQAVAALRKRPAEHYRAILLEGMQYPWLAARRHASDAFVALKDEGAADALAALLDQPDPAIPRQDKDGKWQVRQLVRVNHLRSCLLCHPASFTTDDASKGQIPTPGQPLPRIYYADKKGDFVTADLVYLRQDFSVPHSVSSDRHWPTVQRFDYFVQTRELTEKEARERNHGEESFSQQWLIRRTLCEITGLDGGFSGRLEGCAHPPRRGVERGVGHPGIPGSAPMRNGEPRRGVSILGSPFLILPCSGAFGRQPRSFLSCPREPLLFDYFTCVSERAA